MAETPYSSDRDLGLRPRVEEETAWGGIVTAIRSRVEDGSLGYRYPLKCQNCGRPRGCDQTLLSTVLAAEIPEICWPLSTDGMPPTPAVLDLIEFCYQATARPTSQAVPLCFSGVFAGYAHLGFDRKAGQTGFRDYVNLLFARNRLAYELGEDGQVNRIPPPLIGEVLTSASFRTGDEELNQLLETARVKYLGPNPSTRRESLDVLWGAWERLKTLEKPHDKKDPVMVLLNRAATRPAFVKVLGEEARKLTDIGNSFSIRHKEVDQEPIEHGNHVDYLFHRLFSLIHLLLRMSGRA